MKITIREVLALVAICLTILGCVLMMTNCANTAERETTNRQSIVKTNSLLPDPNPGLRF